MATLPQIISEARLPAEAGLAKADARFPLSTVGSNVAELANRAIDVAGTAMVAQEHARQEAEVSKAMAASATQLDQYRIELDKNPDYAAREGLFNAYARQLEQDTLKGLSGPAAADYQRRLASLYVASAHSVRTGARQDEIQAQRVELDGNVSALLDSAVQARNPLERQTKLDEIRTALERARDTGTITAAGFKALHKQSLEKFDEITVARVMRTAPGAALRLLDDRTATPNLEPLRREQLKINAQTRLEQMSALAKADARAAVSDVIANGFARGNFQPAGLDAVRQKANAFPDLAKQLNEAEYTYRSAADFNAKSAPEQADMIAALERLKGTGNLTTKDTALLDAYHNLNATLLRNYQSDRAATAMQRNQPAAEMYAAAERDYAAAADDGARQDAQQRIQTALRDLQHSAMVDSGQRLAFSPPLPKASAQALKTAIETTSGQRQIDTIDAAAAKYGSLWPEVFRQLNSGEHKLPDYVRVTAAIPATQAANLDKSLIVRAGSVPAKRWDELLPDKGKRGEIDTAVAAEGQSFREPFVIAPGGGAEAYGALAETAKNVARLLVAENRIPDATAAAREAWTIVAGNHWAVAGTVLVPRSALGPNLDATKIAGYQDYIRSRIGRGDLALPEPGPTAATALMTQQARNDQFRAVLARDGRFVSDPFDRGIVLIDPHGRPVPNPTTGQPYSWTWREIESDPGIGAYLGSRRPVRREAIGNGKIKEVYIENGQIIERIVEEPR